MTATQGVKFWTILNAVRNLLLTTSQLADRNVLMWFGPSRPQLAGADIMIWFRPVTDVLDPSPGPQEYGNKVECNFDIHLATRSFMDQAQVDERRAVIYYNTYWKIVLAFQNRNLFPEYIRPKRTDKPWEEPWEQPVPSLKYPPFSVGSMLLTALPVPDKTQSEEGTIESAWKLVVPTVVELTINDRPDLPQVFASPAKPIVSAALSSIRAPSPWINTEDPWK